MDRNGSSRIVERIRSCCDRYVLACWRSIRVFSRALDGGLRSARLPLSSARRRWSRPQTPTTGVNAFFGRWPGDETEEELLDQLDSLRLE